MRSARSRARGRPVQVTEEFYALGDIERAAGLPISTFCDREKDTDLAKSQLGFLQYVCRPLFAAVERVLPGEFASMAVERLDANRHSWAEWQEPLSPMRYYSSPRPSRESVGSHEGERGRSPRFSRESRDSHEPPPAIWEKPAAIG